MRSHVVEPGDCFHSIASAYGLPDGKKLYTHPDNAELKGKRPNPSILHPGDEVVLPDPKLRTENVGTGAVHSFRIKRPRHELRIKLLDLAGQPIANEPYRLQIGEYQVSGETDGAGQLHQPIPTGLFRGTLTIGARIIALDYGRINPIKEVSDAGASGARERLRNLGYDVPLSSAQTNDDEQQIERGIRAALALFQHDAKLESTGELDDQTAAKLVELHGC